MALKWIDGFDFYTAITQLWEEDSANSRFQVGGFARYGAQGSHTNVTSGNAGWARKTIGGTEDTVIVGVAVRPTAHTGATLQFVALYEGTLLHVDLRMVGGSSTHDILVTRNGTTLATAVNALTNNVWAYVELKCTIHDTTGSFELRVNGVNVGSGTNQDTRNGGTGFVDRVLLGTTGVANANYFVDFDDLYVCDDIGSLNNDFLGDCRVAALYPDGAGNLTQWTPSAGSNWQNVDEATPDSDTTYNSEATAGDIDLFTMGNLPTAASVVHGMKEVAFHRKDDAGSRTLRHVVRTGATNYEGGDIAVSDTYTFAGVALRELNPNTAAAWTGTAIDGLEAGYKLQA